MHGNVKDLKDRVIQAEDNIAMILTRLKEIGAKYLFDRKDGKLINMEDREENKTNRYAEISETADLLQMVMGENYLLYFHILEPDMSEVRNKTKIRFVNFSLMF